MTAADMERRLTLAFVMATYVHVVSKDSLVMLTIGIIACLAYPWLMRTFIDAK